MRETCISRGSFSPSLSKSFRVSLNEQNNVFFHSPSAESLFHVLHQIRADVVAFKKRAKNIRKQRLTAMEEPPKDSLVSDMEMKKFNIRLIAVSRFPPSHKLSWVVQN